MHKALVILSSHCCIYFWLFYQFVYWIKDIRAKSHETAVHVNTSSVISHWNMCIRITGSAHLNGMLAKVWWNNTWRFPEAVLKMDKQFIQSLTLKAYMRVCFFSSSDWLILICNFPFQYFSLYPCRINADGCTCMSWLQGTVLDWSIKCHTQHTCW